MRSTSRTVPPELALTGAVLALLIAVFLVPFRAASLWSGSAYAGIGALRESLTAAFVDFWSSGGTQLGPQLDRAVDFWAKFHVVKAVLATALLVAALLLVGRLWRSYLGTATWPRRLGLGLAGAAAALVALLALIMAVANVQGAVAPLSSVLGVMPVGDPGPVLAGTVQAVRHGLAGGGTAPGLDLLLADFVGYHVVMVVLGALVTVGALTAVGVIWQRRRRVPRSNRRERRLLVFVAASLVGLAGFFGLITAANASTVAHPAPALLGFFEGGA